MLITQCYNLRESKILRNLLRIINKSRPIDLRMKKHLLTGFFVAASAGLLVYTAFYNKGVNGGVAVKHQSKQEYKSFVPTAKSNQYEVFSKLFKSNTEEAVVDNTQVVLDNIVGTNTQGVTSVALPFTMLSEPLALAKIGFAEYTLSAGAAQTIINPQTGTSLNIKANSFINEYGELAEGNIKLFMREMHSAPEYFMRGVPMNGFESAGMLELKAFDAEGNTLQLNSEKPVDVLMASTITGGNYSVYTLDESTKSWRLKNAGLKHLTPQTGAKKKNQDFDTNISLAPVKKGIHIFKQELRFKTYLNYRAYPEMEAYNNVEWVYTGKNAKVISLGLMKDRTNPFGSRRKGKGLLFNYWTDVKLQKDNSGQLHMIFTNGAEVVDITVKPEHIYGNPINADAMYDEYTAMAGKKVKQIVGDVVEEALETFDPTTLPHGYTSLSRFTIDELGLYGLNQTLTYNQTANLSVIFTDENNNTVAPTVFYQYDRALNTYQVVSAADIFKVGYNNSNTNILFAVTGSHEVAVLDTKSFDEMLVKSTLGYKVLAKLTRRNIHSVDDVVALFNS